MSTAPRIGVSLGPAYLAGSPQAPERRWYGPVKQMLRDLSAASVSSIELRAVWPQTDVSVALSAVERIWTEHLHVTIHGVLPPWDVGDEWHGSVPALAAILERLGQSRSETVSITVHAYTPDGAEPGDPARRSAARLAQMANWLAESRIPAVLAVELNRRKQKVDPCGTYAGVLDVHERAGHPLVGICFDIGHARKNELDHDVPPVIPPGFLDRVTHTHVHDLGPNGRTHWPLTEGRLPLERFVNDLQEAGYVGVWNLELSPERFADAGAPRDRTLKSVERLRGLLGS